MENRVFKEKELYLYQGVAVAQWQSTPPFGEDKMPKAAIAFYERHLKDARTFYEEKLCKAAEMEYEADANPRKRFSFLRFFATYSLRITYENEGVFSVLRSFSLKRGAESLAEYSFAEVWSESGVLLPAFCFCSQKALKKAAKGAGVSARLLSKSDFYIEEDRLVFLVRGKEVSLLREKTKIPKLFASKFQKPL